MGKLSSKQFYLSSQRWSGRLKKTKEGFRFSSSTFAILLNRLVIVKYKQNAFENQTRYILPSGF